MEVTPFKNSECFSGPSFSNKGSVGRPKIRYYGVSRKYELQILLVGSLQPNLGGGIVAHNTTLSDLQSRVNKDPFVAENVVSAEILEITPSKTDERLKFLLD